MTMNSVAALRPPALTAAASLFRSLGDPTRLAILRRLAGGEARVVDLVAGVDLSQSTVSGHLACLRDCGLIQGRPVGRQVFYAMTHPELMDLFTAAETVLDLTGEHVALRPHYGVDAPGILPVPEDGLGASISMVAKADPPPPRRP